MQVRVPAIFQLQFQQAVALHQAGKLGQAAALYKQILRLMPGNFDVLYALGVCLCQQGELAQGVKHLTDAVRLNPKSDEAQSKLGGALILMGQFNEGIKHCNAAIRLKPNSPEAYFNRGFALAEMQRFDEAVLSYDKAISFERNYMAAHNGRALALLSSNRLEEALAACDNVISLMPGFAEAHNNRASALLKLNRLDDALASSETAISLKPEYADAHSNRGNALKGLDRMAEALASYDKAISLKPDFAEAHHNRGHALTLLERLEDALASYDNAIGLKPDFAEAHCKRAHALMALKRFEDALAGYDKAIALKPNLSEAYWFRGAVRMLLGNFREGLIDHEWRKKVAYEPNPLPAGASPWSDERDLSGKTLFISPELYLGDAIQFCRYALPAEKLGAEVVIATNENLHTLLSTLSPTVRLIAKEAVPDSFDYHCALMSLPFAFKTTMETIPRDVPYLKPEPGRVESWAKRIGLHGFKIGICWQGSTLAYAAPMRRSFPLLLFRNISKLQNVRLISLQKSDGIEQLADLPDDMKVETLGPDFDEGPGAFLDTAAVMQNLDLVITADTAIAHLAGALGRPVWVALTDVPDWRWMLDRQDSPWYPTMRLFRQDKRGDWESVFAGIENQLLGVLKTHG